MRILNTAVFLLLAIQLALIKPLEAVPSYSDSVPKVQLVKFYETEINILSREFCVKFKNISEQILKDEVIKQSKAPALQDFKRNVTKFLEIYPTYMRFGLNKELLSHFIQTTVSYYYEDVKDAEYILQLLGKLGYDDVLDEFEKAFMKFASNQFLNKFEEFKKLIPSNQTKEWQKLFQWGDRLKKCKDYGCFYMSFIYFDKFILTHKEHIFAYIEQQIKDVRLFYGNGTFNIAKGLLKNPKLQQLSHDVKQTLVQKLNKFISDYETFDFRRFDETVKFFYRFILLEFYDNENIPEPERQLLTKIFDEEGYNDFDLKYTKKFKDCVEHKILKKIKYFKSILNQEELSKEKELIDWLNHFESLTTYKERRDAISTELLKQNEALNV